MTQRQNKRQTIKQDKLNDAETKQEFMERTHEAYFLSNGSIHLAKLASTLNEYLHKYQSIYLHDYH
jgi:hypothetical protein